MNRVILVGRLFNGEATAAETGIRRATAILASEMAHNVDAGRRCGQLTRAARRFADARMQHGEALVTSPATSKKNARLFGGQLRGHGCGKPKVNSRARGAR